MLQETEAEMIVTEDKFMARLKHLVEKSENLITVDRKNKWKIDTKKIEAINRCTSDIAYVIFTSGSTGKPKGVMVQHKNITAIIEGQVEVFELNQTSRVMQMLSLSFDAALGEILRSVAAGSTLVFASRDELLPGPELIENLKKHKITAAAFAPALLGALPEESSEDLPDLKSIVVGGEACPQFLAKKWGRSRHILNGYGPTETTIVATLGRLGSRKATSRKAYSKCQCICTKRISTTIATRGTRRAVCRWDWGGKGY